MPNYSQDFVIVRGDVTQEQQKKLLQYLKEQNKDSLVSDWKNASGKLAGLALILECTTNSGPYAIDPRDIQKATGLTNHHIAFAYNEEMPSIGVMTVSPQGEYRQALPSSGELKTTKKSHPNALLPLMKGIPPKTKEQLNALFGLGYNPEINPFFGEYKDNTETRPILKLYAALLNENMNLAKAAWGELNHTPEGRYDSVLLLTANLRATTGPRLPMAFSSIQKTEPYPKDRVLQHLRFLRSLKIPFEDLAPFYYEAKNLANRGSGSYLDVLAMAALADPLEILHEYNFLRECDKHYLKGIEQFQGNPTLYLFRRQPYDHMLPVIESLIKEIAKAKIAQATKQTRAQQA